MEPNTTLGNYTLGERLGSGGMADVFMALQRSVDRTVAIKVMHSHLAHSEDFGARFHREARAMGRLQHPHIARVIDFDAGGPNPYMVIEYLPGGSLHDVLTQAGGALGVAESITIVRQLADALHYAHGMGMVHRDIKPGNVMFVDADRRHAVLTDFGIARLADDSMTATGTLLGTPAYIAPEQVRGEGADSRADQYSLGVMLYEMLTGELPFTADSPHALMMMHVTEPVPSARARNPAVSEALDDIIRRSMAKLPADRFADTGEMARALDQLLETGAASAAAGDDPMRTIAQSAPSTVRRPSTEAGTTSHAAGPPNTTEVVASPGAGPRGRSSGGRRVLAAAAVAVVLAALVAVLFITTRNGDDPTETVAAGDEAAATAAPESATNEPGEAEPTGGDEAEPSVAADQPASTDPAAEQAGGEQAGDPPDVDTDADADVNAEQPVPSFDPEDPPPLFVTNAAIIDDILIVGFDRARLPTAGTAYVAWLDGVEGPVGEVPVDARGMARLEIPPPDPESVTSFFITEEPIGADTSAPTGPIVLRSGVDEVTSASTTEMLATLDAAARELALAIDHDVLMQDEIDLGNLGEVRRHAEHVVNILDGADGDNFGDLDGSGLAENPGDDVGVRGYLAQFASALGDRSPGTDLDPFRVAAADRLAQAERDFLRVLAVDTIEEIDVGAGTADLRATALNLDRMRSLVLRQFALDLVSDDPNGAAGAANAGIVWLAPAGDAVLVRSDLGEFPVLQGEGVDADLVVLAGDSGDAPILGTLDELGTLVAPVAAGGIDGLSVLTIALERPDSEQSQVVARSSVPVEAFAAVEAMLGGDGILARLEAQAQLVVDHTDLMQQEIDGDNLSEVRRHAEHVVNLVEGVGGEHFGDLDGDGVAQNPGEDIGVLTHLDQLRTVAEGLPAETDEQVFYRNLWLTAIETQRVHAVDIADDALRVLATDSPAEAQPFVGQAFTAGVSMLDGTDLDGNGVIDLFAGELGIRGLPDQAPTLVVTPLIRTAD